MFNTKTSATLFMVHVKIGDGEVGKLGGDQQTARMQVRKLTNWELLNAAQRIDFPREYRLAAINEYMSRKGRNLHVICC